MDWQHLDELYELYLLDNLEEREREEIREHLERGCPKCFEQLREAALTVYLLCQVDKSARPGPKLRAQLLRRLRKS